MSSLVDEALDPNKPESVIRWQNYLRAAKNRNLRILKREDWSGLSVDYAMELEEGNGDDQAETSWLRSKFDIQSCWMYLFDTQSAILELRLYHKQTCKMEVVQPPAASTGGTPAPSKLETVDPPAPNSENLPATAARRESEELPLSLRMAMHLQDSMRRIYPAYWSRQSRVYLAGHCLDKVTLHQRGSPDDQAGSANKASDSEEIECSFGTCAALDRTPDVSSGQFHDATTYLTNVITNREPLAAEWWRKLVEPLRPTTTFENRQPGYDGCICYEFIEDDRAVTFAYLAVPNPRTISEGDWMRLASLDDEGKSHTFPYAPGFESAAVREFAYDRFYDNTGEPPAQPKQNVRWLCSGYSFVAVGPSQGSDFYLDEYAGALAHFRRHYFSLGLLAHFQRASLLRFKHELAETMEALDLHTHRVFRRKSYLHKLEQLLNRMNQFRSVYWTRDVSNQEQGREIFAIWKRKLDLAGLFEDVYADVQFASSVLSNWAQQRQADAATNLAWIGALFLIVSPTVGIWTNSLAGSPVINAGWLALGLLCTCVVVWSGRKLLADSIEYVVSILEQRGLAEFPTPKQRNRLLVLSLIVAVFGIGYVARELIEAIHQEVASQKQKDTSKTNAAADLERLAKSQQELAKAIEEMRKLTASASTANTPTNTATDGNQLDRPKNSVQIETGSKSSAVITPPQKP